MALLLYRWFLTVILPFGFAAENNFDLNHVHKAPHPFHVSVAEINSNANDKTLEISCKIFTDDFEDALAKKYKTKVNLVQPPDKSAMDKLVSDYIHNHLAIKADGKTTVMNYIGYEVENEAVYIYLQVNEVPGLKKAEVTDTILHDLFTDQTEIIHVIVNGNRKSMKIDYPVSVASFQF